MVESASGIKGGVSRLDGALEAARLSRDDYLIVFAAAAAIWFGWSPKREELNLHLAEEIESRRGRSIPERAWVMGISAALQVHLSRGDLHAAELIQKELDVGRRESNNAGTVAISNALKALFIALSGDLEQALQVGDLVSLPVYRSVVTARPYLWLGHLPDSTRRAGPVYPILLGSVGRLDEARMALRENATYQRVSSGEPSWSHIGTVSLLEAATLLRDENLVRAALGELHGTAFLTTGWFGALSIDRIRGQAEVFLGHTELARAYYQSALSTNEMTGNRPDMALTRLSLAELLLEHYPDERDAAIEHLDFAISEFREMKMQPSLERALRHRGLLKA
jgi:hypothetical protein